MNLEFLPKQMEPQARPEKPPRPTGARLSQEMLVNMALGGDSQETRKMLERAVLEAVSEHFKYNPKPYLDVLKEPPYSIDLNDPNTPGLANLTQKTSDMLAQKPEWKALITRAKETAIQTQKPLSGDFGAEAYALVSDAATDAIRRIHAERERAASQPEA
jgi:hypothetical protein